MSACFAVSTIFVSNTSPSEDPTYQTLTLSPFSTVSNICSFSVGISSVSVSATSFLLHPTSTIQLDTKATISITGLRTPEQKKSFREKLEALKAKFRDRQIREEAKRQAEELKKQQEEVERRRLAEDARREEERKQREQRELIERQQQEAKKKKEEEKKTKEGSQRNTHRTSLSEFGRRSPAQWTR